MGRQGRRAHPRGKDSGAGQRDQEGVDHVQQLEIHGAVAGAPLPAPVDHVQQGLGTGVRHLGVRESRGKGEGVTVGKGTRRQAENGQSAISPCCRFVS